MPLTMLKNNYNLRVEYQGPKNRPNLLLLAQYLINEFPLPDYKWAYISCRNIMSTARNHTGVCEYRQCGYTIKVPLGDGGKYSFPDMSCMKTLAHEYRHAIQNHDKLNLNNSERDADDFALSVLPKFFNTHGLSELNENFLKASPSRCPESYYQMHEKYL